MNDVAMLQKAVEKLHNCKASHSGTVQVTERFRGKLVWQGAVEVFKLANGTPAKRCYAWNHAEGPKDEMTRVIIVLELPPVTSAQTAVRAAIVAQYKQAKAN